MYEDEIGHREPVEAWQAGTAPEDAQEAKELSAMSESELDAEMQEELGPVGRWMQENVGAAAFANALYPDLLDIDEAKQELLYTDRDI